MVNWERNWRGNGLIAAVLFLVSLGGWGNAATAASAAIGGVYFVLITLRAGLANSITALMRLVSTVSAPDQIPVPAA